MNNQPFAYPPRPLNRTEHIKEALVHLRLGVGGTVDFRWERFCLFIFLFSQDLLVAALPNTYQDLVAIVLQSRTDAVAYLHQHHTKEDLIHLLQARIPKDALIKSINRRNGYSQLGRSELVQSVIKIHHGAPPRANELLHPTVLTLVEFANGKFDEQGFLDGNTTWQVKQGNRVAVFSAKTVLRAFQAFPDLPVTLDNGLFAGQRFPSPQQCVIVYRLLTHQRGSLSDEEAALWIYENLGSSSFFNNFFQAAENFLQPQVASLLCSICEQNPCLALNQELPPYWISLMLNPPAGLAPENRRYKSYKQCHPKYGHARVPLYDCWVLAIRCTHPGSSITGFQPRYLARAAEVQVVVELPIDENHLENQLDDSEIEDDSDQSISEAIDEESESSEDERLQDPRNRY